MKITGAIFDMDGTLLDSMDYWSIAPEEYLLSQGITPYGEARESYLTLGLKGWYEEAVKKYKLTHSYEEVKSFIYGYMNEKYRNTVKAKDGAINLLESLYQKGVKMCLATATDRDTVEPILKKLNMEKYFQGIFTTGEVGVGKNEPVIYQKALEFLGTDKESTYVFEDAVYAMETAFNNGFKVVGIYDKNVLTPESQVKKLCHIYLDKDNQYKLKI